MMDADDLPIPGDTTIAGIQLHELDAFVQDLADGIGPHSAAIARGWSPAQLKRLMADRDFAEIMDVVNARLDESVEKSLHRAAVAGNVRAIQMWLYNRKPDVWKDQRRIVVERTETVDHTVVVSVRQSVAELIREHGVAALQPGGALDIIDAEVIDDGSGEHADT